MFYFITLRYQYSINTENIWVMFMCNITRHSKKIKKLKKHNKCNNKYFID